MGMIRRFGRDVVRTGYHAVARPLGFAVRWSKRRLGLLRPVKILPYRGFGNREQLIVIGRVMEDRPFRTPTPLDTWWRNGKAMVNRFMTAEVPDVAVRARMDGVAVDGRADHEGYFDFVVAAPADLDPHAPWHDVDVELVEQVRPRQQEVSATCRVFVPSDQASFGVVSDLDDTVLYSHATDLWKLIKLTMLHNAHTRSPLTGAAGLYRALERGGDGRCTNPFFYVSSAAWNLYDVFLDFLELHGFPTGPVMLRDFGIGLFRSSHAHKIEKVERIFAATGALPFLLIGDAGQADAQLYHRIAREFPGRVAAIYIRAVSWLDRSAEVRELAADLRSKGVEMLLVEDTRALAEHALGRGFISPDALAEIAAEREAEERTDQLA